MWAAPLILQAGKELWLVVDGFYAKRPFLRAALKAGAVVVGRLRKDAHLRDLPTKPRKGQRPRRGRRRKFGKNRINLAKRAGQKRGWQQITCLLYGQLVTKTYKTFLATYRPAGGVLRVVIVKEVDGWLAFFCTDANATVQQLLETFADRAAIKQNFHDLKEVWGTGQQQVRYVWANVGTYHLNLWIHTLVELWAWNKPKGQLCDRRDSPWDDSDRRPSHSDRRKALQRQCIEEEFLAIPNCRALPQKIRRLFRRLARMAA